jgi:NAD kinase
MSVFTLQANSNYAAQYTVPANGTIRFEVESESPVAVVVMDSANLAEFRAGREYRSYGSPATLNAVHRQTWSLPFRGQWFLVIINYNQFPIAVHFNAWS